MKTDRQVEGGQKLRPGQARAEDIAWSQFCLSHWVMLGQSLSSQSSVSPSVECWPS